ncbi:MAG: hypothetical protein KJ970_03680 [Candidatus Eisenbacteria bacterium]|uniref:Uncharacterized protein n=1 Tax=Eiseniibacteriota bacterium TaxID=2212470 RepID=A0A948RV36_UNCEI|nr:hypothetical protein [Candidatus Eisenbacteria bacterium]MBU1949921.1 hypothetical protein [Candidatus Eisenbacteria bacterium]MBU2690002.1 hypothetical protein [Candidatus Eisenbacteria bacterium]
MDTRSRDPNEIKSRLRPEWMNGLGTLLIGIGALFTPLVVGSMTASITKSNSESEVGVRMIEVAVDLLKQSPDSLGRDRDSKEWARKIVNNYSPIPLPEDAVLTSSALRVVGPDRVINFSLTPDSLIADVNLFQNPDQPVNQWNAPSAQPMMTIMEPNRPSKRRLFGQYLLGNPQCARFLLPRTDLGRKLRIVLEMVHPEMKDSGWPVQEISNYWRSEGPSLHVQVTLENDILVTRRW